MSMLIPSASADTQSLLALCQVLCRFEQQTSLTESSGFAITVIVTVVIVSTLCGLATGCTVIHTQSSRAVSSLLTPGVWILSRTVQSDAEILRSR